VFFFKKKKDIEEETVQVKKRVEFNTFGFNDILHFIKRETGVDLFGKKSIMETRIKLFCEEKDIHSFKKLDDEIKYNKKLKQEIINLLTVNETYFYREEKQLQEAVDFAKSLKRNINILCAPCASGEEVYTLAMMMSEQLKETKFNITGIDINSEAIAKAKKGIYSQRSLHKLSEELKNKYFDKNDDMYRVKSYLFSNVKFLVVNIFEHSFLSIGKFDIIFSRNMLIYFDEEFRVATMKRFSQLIKDDGRLFLGHADIVPKNEYFVKNGYGSSCYYTKNQR
jgi:chemotaxis protein methyltransferase CheR